MANHLYFPALKKYDTLSLNDQFVFFPIVADRNDYYGSIDGLSRKTSMSNIISFLNDNLTISSGGTFGVSEEGNSIGTNFTAFNFIGGSVTSSDAGSGVVNISIVPTTDTQMMNTNLTSTGARVHELDGNNWKIENSGVDMLTFVATGNIVTLGTDENYFRTTAAGTADIRIADTPSVLFSETRTTSYLTFILDQAKLGFMNAEDKLITIEPASSGVTPTAYTLPVAGSEGFLKNDGSNVWTWEAINLMSSLNDVSPSFYEDTLDWVNEIFTTWDGNKPSASDIADWVTNFNTITYILVWDPVNSIWIPMPAFDIISVLQTDVNVYTDNGILNAARTIDTNGNLFSIHDADAPVTSTGPIRLHGHRFRADGNDVQIGYYSAEEGTAQDAHLKFFTQATTNSGVPDGTIRKETGATGAFVMKNHGVGELWLQNVASGQNNKIILRTDGEVEFNMYGLGNFVGVPATAPVFDEDGIIHEVSPLTSIYVACSDETSDLVAATDVVTFRTRAFVVTKIRSSVNTASAGSVITVDVNVDGSTILSTKLSIDAGEKTSRTSATPLVITDGVIPEDSEVTIDIDVIGSSTAGKGLKLEFIGYYTV